MWYWYVIISLIGTLMGMFLAFDKVLRSKNEYIRYINGVNKDVVDELNTYYRTEGFKR